MSSDTKREARTFFVDTRFQRMARRPGGVPRAQALENAQARIEEHKPEVEAWLDRELQALVDVVRSAQAGTAEPQWTEAVELHSRQLRDIGATIGFELLTFVAGNLCDIVEGTKADDQRNMESIACHVDALLLARQRQYRNMRLEQLPDLIKGLCLVAENASIHPDDAAK
jgi:hypothetical protein